MLYSIDPELRGLSKQDKSVWEDATGRAAFSKMLILDEMPGMLNQMTESTYPGQAGRHPDFGKDVLDLARTMDE